jgi:hypothetical protein
MSWHYNKKLLESSLSSREQEEGSSPPNSTSNGEPSARSNTNLTASKGSSKGKKKDTSARSRSGTTSPPSTGDRGVDKWISFLAASRVRTFQSVGPERDSKGSDQDSGITWVGLSMRFSPETCGLRTHQCLFEEDLDEYSVILPQWGMMLRGELFQRKTPEPHTFAKEHGSLHGWATPAKRDWKDTAGSSKTGVNPDGSVRNRMDRLAMQVYHGDPWPTPTKAEGEKIPNRPNFGKVALSNNPRIVGLPDRPKGKKGQSLESIKNIPTPTKGDAKSSGSRNTKDSKANAGVSLTDFVRGDGGTGREDIFEAEYVGALFPTDEELLGGMAQERDVEQWPTPTKDASNERTQPYEQGGTSLSTAVKDEDKPGQLDPDWVEWLMGWPIGWTSAEPLESIKPLSWGIDPGSTGEVPRTSRNIPNRVKRIEAIGDGQVPAAVALAVSLLNKARENIEKIKQ